MRKPAVPKVKNAGVVTAADRSLPPGAAGDRRASSRRRRRPPHADPPPERGADRAAADAGRGRGVRRPTRSPDAYEKLVDRLLASPHFGERWARHWLDVVRFTETHGNEWNYEVHHAWRYRDYLIRAFNDDVPYDQFVREHIAGDLLRSRAGIAQDEVQRVASIGTAFYRFGEVNHDDCIEFRQIGYDLLDNQIDTLTKAFQATTVACARCHDHKLDAVSMKDYYALLGILRSSRPVSHSLDAAGGERGAAAAAGGLKSQVQKEVATRWQQDAKEVGRYLKAAQAGARQARATRPNSPRTSIRSGWRNWPPRLKPDKPPLENPAHGWTALHAKTGDAFAEAWKTLSEQVAREQRERAAFNGKHFTSFGDFPPARRATGRCRARDCARAAASAATSPSAAEGDAAVSALLPAGFFTHALSERLNGALLAGSVRQAEVSQPAGPRRASECGAAGFESLPVELSQLSRAANAGVDVGHVPRAQRGSGASLLRGDHDEVRQSQVPGSARHAGRRQCQSARAVGRGGGRSALVLRRDAGRAARLRRAAQRRADPPSPVVRGRGTQICRRVGRALRRGGGRGGRRLGRRPRHRRRRSLARLAGAPRSTGQLDEDAGP